MSRVSSGSESTLAASCSRSSRYSLDPTQSAIEWRTWLDKVPNSRHPLRSLISRAKAGIEMVRVESEIGVISDSRGTVSRAVEKPPTSYMPDLIALLRTEYESGKSVRAICNDYGLDRSAVMKRLRASGAKLRSQGLTPEQAVLAAEMYQTRLTLAEVGAHFEVAQETVGRNVRNQGVPLRPPLLKAAPSA